MFTNLFEWLSQMTLINDSNYFKYILPINYLITHVNYNKYRIDTVIDKKLLFRMYCSTGKQGNARK